MRWENIGDDLARAASDLKAGWDSLGVSWIVIPRVLFLLIIAAAVVTIVGVCRMLIDRYSTR